VEGAPADSTHPELCPRCAETIKESTGDDKK
jgi:hypothetical protein